MLKRVLLCVCTIFSAALFTHAAAQDIYKKVTDGIIVSLPQKSAQDSRLLRLQVISDKIIHVTATPESSFPRNKSLMALDRINSPVNWNVVQKGNQLLLSTASVTAHVLLPQGLVSFTDKAGKLILAKTLNGHLRLCPTMVKAPIILSKTLTARPTKLSTAWVSIKTGLSTLKTNTWSYCRTIRK